MPISKITNYPDQYINHFYNNRFIGLFNELENLDLRCQIAERKLEGYYIKFNNQKIKITKTGELESWPDGLWDTSPKLYARLFKAR